MKKIAIVDDDDDCRESLAILVEDAGYEPELITGTFGNDKQLLINEIRKHNVFGVISDHRLSHGHLANFYGSELLASLYDLKIPSVLITQFLDVDADTSIRRYRDKLPAVIGRGTQSPELIDKLLEFSKKEIVSGRTTSRKPHRALIRVDDYSTGAQEGLIEGIITNWNSALKVKFPVELIPEDIRRQMIGSDISRLMAFVNTGASNHSDIFITDIHLAPVLGGIDELS
jgi:hypothetical protein